MNFAIALLAMCAVASMVTPVVNQQVAVPIPIVASENINEGIDGKFHYSFETGDGTKAAQSGQLKQIDAEHAGEAVEGEYSYVGTDGVTYSVKYIADENGFQAQGDHLPTPPPVPEPIARALAYLATLPPPADQVSSGNGGSFNVRSKQP